jgi:translation initiation factor 5B
MAPKKKNNKKNDEWESELGDSADPIAAATQAAKEAEDKNDVEDEEFGGGGLMAAMKKNRNKKKAKGKPVDDFLDGDDPAAAEELPDLTEKAPVEASLDDEFNLPDKKGKAKVAANGASKAKEEDEEEERGADGKVMTKKEKEKAKKEREKQRKKEQVIWRPKFLVVSLLIVATLGCKEKDCCASCKIRCHETCCGKEG